MSEYQYYEFHAVDRRLTPPEIAELRKLSSRARITPTSLVNVYHFGDFRGDPLTLMRRYFDAFVYVANWGSHHVMLRLPRPLVDLPAVGRYAVEPSLAIHADDQHVVFELQFQEDEPSGWMDDEESAAWLPALLPLRADLATGDLRALYLAWLTAVPTGFVAEEAMEPPVPPGLGGLTPALETLVEFLGVDPDLLAVAAERSAASPVQPGPRELEQWVLGLSAQAKDALLRRVVRGEAAQVAPEIERQVRQRSAGSDPAPVAPRSVAELIMAATAHATERRRREAEQQRAEQARLDRERAAARERHLAGLVGREPDLWQQVDTLIETKRPAEYDRAVELLTDLRDLAARAHASSTYTERLRGLYERQPLRPALRRRIEAAKLLR